MFLTTGRITVDKNVYHRRYGLFPFGESNQINNLLVNDMEEDVIVVERWKKYPLKLKSDKILKYNGNELYFGPF